MTTGRINQVITKPTQAFSTTEDTRRLAGRCSRVQCKDTVDFKPKRTSSLQCQAYWCDGDTNLTQACSKNSCAPKLDPTKEEPWESFQRKTSAKTRNLCSFPSICYSESNSQHDQFPSLQTTKSRKAQKQQREMSDRNQHDTLRLHWVECVCAGTRD